MIPKCGRTIEYRSSQFATKRNYFLNQISHRTRASLGSIYRCVKSDQVSQKRASLNLSFVTGWLKFLLLGQPNKPAVAFFALSPSRPSVRPTSSARFLPMKTARATLCEERVVCLWWGDNHVFLTFPPQKSLSQLLLLCSIRGPLMKAPSMFRCPRDVLETDWA